VRLARAKADAVAARHPDAVVLSADTVVAVGRRLLEKPADAAEAERFLRLLSGRNHRVFTAVALATAARTTHRCVETRVTLKRLSEAEIAAYVAGGDWQGKAGGYGIQGPAAAFVTRIVGSHPAVMGLPLPETVNLLAGAGWHR
jgi:septum formation protein